MPSSVKSDNAGSRTSGSSESAACSAGKQKSYFGPLGDPLLLTYWEGTLASAGKVVVASFQAHALARSEVEKVGASVISPLMVRRGCNRVPRVRPQHAFLRYSTSRQTPQK